VREFVADVENSKYQPRYLRKPYGDAVQGWAGRLKTYFWPKPEVDAQHNLLRLEPLIARGKMLSEKPRPWDEDTKTNAVAFARGVFEWGRVQPKTVTWQQVDAVLRAASSWKEVANAPMNSGWSKVAALGTAHLEGQNRSQVIWDSRVSNSLVRRIDRLLHASGTNEIPGWLPRLGRVPARVQERWAIPLHFDWPYGYGRWEYQFAASRLVHALRDELNLRKIPMPAANHQREKWHVRAVEMALFMDGA
jgi:hypothetical protein